MFSLHNWRRSCLALLLLGLALTAASTESTPSADDVHAATGSLVIDKLPALSMKIDPALKYIGAFPFDIRGIAGGYRYVWAEVGQDGRAGPVFIVQREGFYPSSDGKYVYPARNPQTIGGEIYGHGLYIYDNDVTAAELPHNEAYHTKKFFADRKIEWNSQVVMSRFARIVDAAGKNEIIFFYFDPLARHTGKSVAELDALGDDAPEVKAIHEAVDRNSRRAFSISKARP